jgi:acyl-CoA synthetase (NDP forming)
MAALGMDSLCLDPNFIPRAGEKKKAMDRDRRKKFDRMFFPKSLALVGISRTDTDLGGQFFLKNLQRAEYPGRIYLVHPTASEIGGWRTYASLIIVDRLIPRLTYATGEGKEATPQTLEYLRQNRFRKPLVMVIDGSGEDPSLAAEAARLRSRYCQAGIPAYASLPMAARALAHWAAYREKAREEDFPLEAEEH